MEFDLAVECHSNHGQSGHSASSKKEGMISNYLEFYCTASL